MRVRELFEKYTGANSHLLRYFREPEFDPYTYWNEVRVWFEDHPKFIRVASKAAGKKFHNADEIGEEEPDLFAKLPPALQKEIGDWVIEWLHQHAPHEAPSYTHAGLSKKQLLPRTTWLIHFTDDPDGVAEKGFTIGTHDVNKLGLTTYMSNDSFEKGMGGYNFAFLANSRDARWAESEHKYGKHAVMFQNSGVLTHHYADEETQVIFNGEDVDPRDIIILRDYGDEWRVEPRRPTRRYGTNDSSLFKGDFETVVLWVEHDFAQSRRYLTLR